MKLTDIIELIQPDFGARLQSLEFFGDIAIGMPRLWKEGEKLSTPKSINEQLDRTLAGMQKVNGKIGATVRVFQPTINVDEPNSRKCKVMLLSRSEVHPILNNTPDGTNKKVSRIGLEVLRAGLGFTLMQGICTLYAEGQSYLPYVSDDRGFETVDVLHQANCTLGKLEACLLPKLVRGDNGAISFEGEAGAEIYYSTDLSFPTAHILGAKLFDQPFIVNSGTRLRWAAYAPGLAGSDIGFETIEY